MSEQPDNTTPLLRVEDLAVSFDNGDGPRIQAVDGANLAVYPRQTVAVVGESGCGKSVTAMSLLGLVRARPRASIGASSCFNRAREWLICSSSTQRRCEISAAATSR